MSYTRLNISEAKKWSDNALVQIPARKKFFMEFARQINKHKLVNILEVGSGPGLLAAYILKECDIATYSLLDFSDAMHKVAKTHLTDAIAHLSFLTKDLSLENWYENVAPSPCIVTLQTVHEMGTKYNSAKLLQQMFQVLEPGGCLLLCDLHYDSNYLGDDPNMYMTLDERNTALSDAGFTDVNLVGVFQDLSFVKAFKSIEST